MPAYRFGKPDQEVIHGLLLEQGEIEQILGRALRYPPYPDIWPDANGAVCTGEHTVVRLAMEAAGRISELEAEVERLKKGD